MKPNSNGKYSFTLKHYNSYFLPSIADVTSLLGLPDNPIKMIPLFESLYDSPLNVGRSSRHQITKKGVAKPTRDKLVSWFNRLPIPANKLIHMPTMLKTYRAMRVSSNAGLWLSSMHGLKLSSHDNEFKVLNDFINERSEADFQMLKSIKKKIKSKKVAKDDIDALWQEQLSTWEKHSLVPSEQLNYYTSFAKSPNALVFEQEQNKLKLLESAYHLIFDFYLSAIASYEVGLVLYEKRHYYDIDVANYHGLFSSVVETWVSAAEEHTCFEAVLLELRKILGDDTKPMAWRELSSFIPINNAAQISENETLKDRQYGLLKDWRKNQNMPSDTKFREFVESAFRTQGNVYIEPILIYFRIAKGLDSIVTKQLHKVEDKACIPILKKVISNYPLYFNRFKKLVTE